MRGSLYPRLNCRGPCPPVQVFPVTPPTLSQPPTSGRGLKVPKGSHSSLWPGCSAHPSPPERPQPPPPGPAQSPSVPPPPGREPRASPVSPSPASRLLPLVGRVSRFLVPVAGCVHGGSCHWSLGGRWPAGPCPQHPAEGGTWWLLRKTEQKECGKDLASRGRVGGGGVACPGKLGVKAEEVHR